jgi:PAS domain S-box-containing protein
MVGEAGPGVRAGSLCIIGLAAILVGFMLRKRGSWAISARRDAALLIAIGSIALVVLRRFNSFEWLYDVSRGNEYYQLDELVLAFVITTIALSIFALRRWRELQRELATRAITEVELRRQATVFETIGDAVLICDTNARILDANPATVTVLGYSREELIGQTPALWHHPDRRDTIIADIGDALAATGSWIGTYSVIRRDGSTGTVETRLRAIVDTKGGAPQTIGVMRDISERCRLETQLLQAQKLESIGSLSAGIAHEINTPIQYVGDNIRFLGQGVQSLSRALYHATRLVDVARAAGDQVALVAEFDRVMHSIDFPYINAELPQALDHAQEGCERVSEIVQALKGFASPDGAEKVLADINGCVRNTIAVCRNEWKYVATLRTELDPDLPLVPCLPAEVQQVMLNLVINATQAIAEARSSSHTLGSIVVTTRYDSDWVEIRVEDDGPGIPKSIQGRVFDPFFTTKAPGKGMGQGLSFGHATIVQKHQGTFTFESVENRGTTFVIRLPLALDFSMAAA